MSDRHIPVLVVGGSLVGLSTSAMLGAHGVPHLLVESHSGTAIHPRAASFHQATMEAFRSVGLQQAVEEAAALEFVQNGAIVAVESLGGKELQYFYSSFNDGVEGLSPTSRLFITQVGLEPVLRKRAEELGAEHRFGTELISFEQHEDRVVSVLRPRDGGPDQVVSSDYLVAADGAHSRIREQLGIPMAGRGSFASCVTIYFKSDVRELIGDRNLSVVYVNHPGLLGFFRFSITGDSGFLAVFATFDAAGNREPDVAEDVSPERCIALVRTALGCGPDHPVDIESVQQWDASAATAERFRDGRVLLAGDSAHVMPPTGGFGGNTGVADASNLAWKLALVTKGLAGPDLLDSYDAERRPAAALTVEQAYTRYALRVDSSLPREDLAPSLDDASIELGAVVRSGAVAARSPAEGPLDDPRKQTWAVGARVPHLDLGEGRSTLDVPGGGFALLIRDAAGDWREHAEAAARASGAGVTVAEVPGAGPAAVLVRPDGVIAWRADAPDAAGSLPGVLLSLLARA